MMYNELRIGGFGGQGIILAGAITGQAAAIHDGKNATLVKSYGPEARGGACSTQLIISDSEIYYPYVREPSILVVMSQEAFTKFVKELKEGGTLIVDEDLVKKENYEAVEGKYKLHKIPATRIAEQMGRRIIANIVMLGFFTKVTGIVSAEGMKEVIKKYVPKGTEQLNLNAFQKGYEYAEKEELAGAPSGGSH
jgi:2-oxoglutarate ferredoxin oxidoreductase subunit gamma